MEGDREMCLAAGMDDYISKPIWVEALIQALERGSADVYLRRIDRDTDQAGGKETAGTVSKVISIRRP